MRVSGHAVREEALPSPVRGAATRASRLGDARRRASDAPVTPHLWERARSRHVSLRRCSKRRTASRAPSPGRPRRCALRRRAERSTRSSCTSPASSVAGLDPALFHYDPLRHGLELLRPLEPGTSGELTPYARAARRQRGVRRRHGDPFALALQVRRTCVSLHPSRGRSRGAELLARRRGARARRDPGRRVLRPSRGRVPRHRRPLRVVPVPAPGRATSGVTGTALWQPAGWVAIAVGAGLVAPQLAPGDPTLARTWSGARRRLREWVRAVPRAGLAAVARRRPDRRSETPPGRAKPGSRREVRPGGSDLARPRARRADRAPRTPQCACAEHRAVRGCACPSPGPCRFGARAHRRRVRRRVSRDGASVCRDRGPRGLQRARRRVGAGAADSVRFGQWCETAGRHSIGIAVQTLRADARHGLHCRTHPASRASTASCKSFGAVTALDGVDLELRRGRDPRAARAERRGQVDGGGDPPRASSSRPGPRTALRARSTHSLCAPTRRRRAAGDLLPACDPRPRGRRPRPSPFPEPGHHGGDTRSSRPGGPRRSRRGRPLRRPASAPRRGARARRPSGRALPRRADGGNGRDRASRAPRRHRELRRERRRRAPDDAAARGSRGDRLACRAPRRGTRRARGHGLRDAGTGRLDAGHGPRADACPPRCPASRRSTPTTAATSSTSRTPTGSSPTSFGRASPSRTSRWRPRASRTPSSRSPGRARREAGARATRGRRRSSSRATRPTCCRRSRSRGSCSSSSAASSSAASRSVCSPASRRRRSSP